MTVIRLFPGPDEDRPRPQPSPSRVEVEQEPETTSEPPRPTSRPKPPRPQPAHPQSISPAALLAQLVVPRGAPQVRSLSPAEVIARGLNRPHPGQPTRSDLFWSIWQNHSAFLAQRSVRLSGGNRADAEDALSNAMLRAVQSFSTQDVQNPRAWLLRILHNIAMDTHRQNGRHLPVDETSGEPPTPAASFDQKSEPTPEETLAQSQFNRALQAALRQLPGDYLTPLMLHLDDVPDDEIARRLNISQALVRKRRQLAKERLRELLKR